MTGQINMDSSFGQAIATIASNPAYKKFCEVGTWNGLGSTRCFYEGIRRNPGAELISLEGNYEMYKSASTVWKDVPQVKVLYGTLHRNIMRPSEVISHPLYSFIREHYSQYYESEKEACLNAPLLTVPKCDVVLLDGGEFSTEGDWKELYHPGLKVVILDDTHVIKTNRIYNELKRDFSWRIVYNDVGSRNGCAIFVRVYQ
jgi:hypothetical protein